MPESEKHIELVLLLNQYAQQVLHMDKGYILLDTPSNSTGKIPPIIGSYRPDIYAYNDELLIIGDAKTIKDWDNKHSIKQYLCYYHHCNEQSRQAVLLIAVPWRIVSSVKNRLTRILNHRQNLKVDVHVISEMWSIRKCKE